MRGENLEETENICGEKKIKRKKKDSQKIQSSSYTNKEVIGCNVQLCDYS